MAYKTPTSKILSGSYAGTSGTSPTPSPMASRLASGGAASSVMQNVNTASQEAAGLTKEGIIASVNAARTGVPEISAETIGKTTGITVPAQDTKKDALTSTLAETAGTVEAQKAQAEVGTPEQTEPSLRDQVQNEALSLFQEGQDFDSSEIMKDTGVYDQRDIVNQLSQGYDSAIVNQRRTIQEMRQNPEGKLRGALEADIANYQYESDQNLADKAMALHYAREDYNGMLQIANDAIAAEDKRYERGMNYLNNLYTQLGNDLTDSEKLELSAALNMQQTEHKALMDAKSEAVRVMGINGATPQEIINAKNATTVEGVWQAAGAKGIDPSLALAQDKFAWDKWYAGQKMDADAAVAAGKLAGENLEKGESTAIVLKQTGKILHSVNEALNNTIGLAAATGQAKGAFGTSLAAGGAGALAGAGAGTVVPGIGTALGAFGGFTAGAVMGTVAANNAKENFENDIKLVYSASALSELANLGFSLAPVTEKEIELVGDKANEVSAAVTVNPETGEMVIKGSTSEFKQDLKDLQTQLNQTVTALSNDPYLHEYLLANDIGEVETLLGQQ